MQHGYAEPFCVWLLVALLSCDSCRLTFEFLIDIVKFHRITPWCMLFCSSRALVDDSLACSLASSLVALVSVDSSRSTFDISILVSDCVPVCQGCRVRSGLILI